MNVAAVVIGRNEGARLIACLDALDGIEPVIYVDSGSTDGSVAAAQRRGAQVITLDMTRPFTAARARNAGLAAVPEQASLVQFLDGDCILQPTWLAQAQTFLADHPNVAVVCGRRREMYPDASAYNALIDGEWDTPIGETRACGGDALMRVAAVRDVGGYRDDLIAGEEPELCVRLRAAGWKIWRLEAEMTAHDAQITRFGQWWQRSVRAGHAFAEGAALHGAWPERHWVAETRRALFWGAVLPAGILFAGVLVSPWALAALAIYPAQMLRLAVRGGMRWALFSVIGKAAEARGALGYYFSRVRGGRKSLIEYK